MLLKMELCDDIGQVGEGKAPSFAARTPKWGVGGGVVADKHPL